MEIKDLITLLPKKIDRSATEKFQLRNIKRDTSVHVENRPAHDHVETSEEARALQRSEDELKDDSGAKAASGLYVYRP